MKWERKPWPTVLGSSKTISSRALGSSKKKKKKSSFWVGQTDSNPISTLNCINLRKLFSHSEPVFSSRNTLPLSGCDEYEIK